MNKNSVVRKLINNAPNHLVQNKDYNLSYYIKGYNNIIIKFQKGLSQHCSQM